MLDLSTLTQDEFDTAMSFAIGLSDVEPTARQLDVDPERLAGFLSRTLNNHGVEIVPKPIEAADATAEAEETPAEYCRRWVSAFGAQQATEYLAEGLTWSEAITRDSARLTAENERLRQQIAAGAGFSRGEKTPVSFGDNERSSGNGHVVADLKHKVGSDGLARFAAGINFKGKGKR